MASIENSSNGETPLVIRKPVYESLPYLYLAVGVVAVLVLHHPLAYLCGALLYAAGAAIWVMRSAYRRRNHNRVPVGARRSLQVPEQLYEYLPFIYIAIGVAILVAIDSPLRFLPGLLFCLAGGLVWMIRAIYRSKLVYDSLG
ncbi:hypothetical protein [Motiliproteus sp. SC1-56]|uniref:hypothetical protein n=1 Tax=Motiliproteus sp. SC1-56 TaxID=2799565 RepID=UPI001A8E99F8|nr:hypothetical protein [Motiliproteus sp. SC1-56]